MGTASRRRSSSCAAARLCWPAGHSLTRRLARLSGLANGSRSCVQDDGRGNEIRGQPRLPTQVAEMSSTASASTSRNWRARWCACRNCNLNLDINHADLSCEVQFSGGSLAPSAGQDSGGECRRDRHTRPAERLRQVNSARQVLVSCRRPRPIGRSRGRRAAPSRRSSAAGDRHSNGSRTGAASGLRPADTARCITPRHPVGAENCVTSCDLRIFVDQSAQPVPPQDAGSRTFCGWTDSPGGRLLLQRPVRAVGVVV